MQKQTFVFALNITSIGKWEKIDKGDGSRKIKFSKRNSHTLTSLQPSFLKFLPMSLSIPNTT